MKAILIDPFTRTVSEHNHSGDWRDISKTIRCGLFCVVYLNNMGDTLYLDDEGLYAPDQKYFRLPSRYPEMLAGRGLILGADDMGDSTDCLISVEEIEDEIKWVGDSIRPVYVFS
jgi:hypothetical protein